MKSCRVALIVLCCLVVMTSYAYAQSGTLRGIHLPNRWNYGPGVTQGDRWALRQYNPGMVVVLLHQITLNTVVYLRDELSPSAEIFVRWQPPGDQKWTCSCPPLNYKFRSGRTCTRNYATNNVMAMKPEDVAQNIVDTVRGYERNLGWTVKRWIPGNEPDFEWAGGAYRWSSQTWQDINDYYTDIKFWVEQKRGATNIEMYCPSFDQFASVGVGNYNSDGTVSRYYLDNVNGRIGLTYIKPMIEYYRNYTWHNYWWPGCAWQHRVNQFFPSWLNTYLYSNGYPSRITEAGWIPDYRGDRDAWTTGPNWANWYEQELQYFVNSCARASGVAVWLLGSDADEFAIHEATRRQTWNSPNGALSKMRPWFYYYAKRCQGDSNIRNGLGTRRNLSLNPPGIWAGSETSDGMNPPWQAFDGLYLNMWNSGGFPTRWIQWCLENGQTFNYVDKIRALVSQNPAGTTTHNLKIWSGTAWTTYTKTGYTSENQWLEWSFNPPIRVNQAHIETTQSPSWVAWREIETWGY